MAATRIVSVREFRKNIAKLLREVQRKGTQFVIFRYSRPVALVTPVKHVGLEMLARDIAKAREEVRKGKVYTSEEVLAFIER